MKTINKYLNFFDQLIVKALKAFPNHAYTQLVYKFARIEKPLWLKNAILKTFVSIYKVDLSYARETKLENYKNFSELFTRRLKKKARLVDSNPESVISPVDGTICEIGLILKNSILQAKSKKYSIKELIKDPQIAKRYDNGLFVTIYLAPHNYHRVHFPLTCQVESMSYIPGSLLSVSRFTQNKVDNLFVNQERAVINLKLNDEVSPNPFQMSLVMVGALGVGSINTVWHGMLTPPYGNKKTMYYPYGQIMNFNKADELGHFDLGSTVIMLFPKNAVKLEGGLKAGSKVRLGQAIAHFDTGKKTKIKTPYELSKEKKVRGVEPDDYSEAMNESESQTNPISEAEVNENQVVKKDES